jgi:hypothetical protein
MDKGIGTVNQNDVVVKAEDGIEENKNNIVTNLKPKGNF